MRIGIDVGGTNTDAVLISSKGAIIASSKRPTTEDVSGGLVLAARDVIAAGNIRAGDVDAVMIGTTHFSNAFVERQRLLEVGILRIALPATKGILPLISWPQDIVDCIGRHVFLVRGGHQYDGRLNSELDEPAVAEAARAFKSRNLKAVAITSLFASVVPDMELRAAEIVREEMGDVAITLSHTIGSIGILMRENSAIINASLSALAAEVIHSFGRALNHLEISAPFYLSQNDGTLMNADFTVCYPVLTFASGLTNSLRGAAMLSGVEDSIVIDVGGTTTDIGVLVNGYPRESTMTADIGGIRTNFRMPDVLTLGLGGGSRVVECAAGKVSIGPQSVGFRLPQQAMVFGGDVLTATDIAVAAGQAEVGDSARVKGISGALVESALNEIHQTVNVGVDRMRTSANPVPLILVGGGAILLHRERLGAENVISPPHAEVANAVGASIAKVGGEVDKVYFYNADGRERSLERACQEAVAQAHAAGAEEDGSVEIVSIEELPLPYVSNGAVRVRVKAVGDLRIDNQAAIETREEVQ